MTPRIHRLCGGRRTLMWDTFTDVDGINLDQHAPDDGVPWMQQGVLLYGPAPNLIANNRLYFSGVSAGTGLARKKWSNHRRNYSVQVDVIKRSDTGASSAGPFARLTRIFQNSWMRARYNDVATDNWTTDNFVVGAFPTIGANVNHTMTIDVPETIRLEVRGGRAFVWINDVLTIQGNCYNGKAQGGYGSPGLSVGGTNLTGSTGVHIDNWMVTR